MRRRVRTMAAALAALMLLGGCGEAAYDLTEQEESLIVNYSAHVVAKYNRFQSEGLTYVNLEEASSLEETDPAEEPEDTGSEPPEAAADAGESVLPAGTEGTEAPPVMQTASFDGLFGSESLRITYTGAELADGYVEDTYFAMYPDPGYQYLILNLAVANDGDAAAAADFLSVQAGFTVTVNGEVSAGSMATMLTEDFSSFQATLEAGETVDTVLIFQVPASVTEAGSVELVVHTDQDYQIVL